LIAEIVPSGIETNVLDSPLGAFKISNVTPAQVLKSLKDRYGFVSYFQEGILFVGFAYQNPNSNTIPLHFQKNVADISQLTYRFKDDNKIKVKAISILPDNKKLQVEVGDDDGEIRTLHFFNVTSESALKKRAEQEIEKLKVDGYRGSIKSFGQPFIKHGDVLDFEDDIFPERASANFVDKVVVNFNTSVGFKRTSTLGRQQEA